MKHSQFCKRPKLANEPQFSRTPRLGGDPGVFHKKPVYRENPEAYRSHHPSWGISSADMEGPWACARLVHDQDARGRLLQHLKTLESNTWAELETQHAKGKARHHYMEPKRLCRDAQTRLERLQIDVDRVFSLHLEGAIRLWGVRDGAAFRILWWDPKHTVYPVSKRHT